MCLVVCLNVFIINSNNPLFHLNFWLQKNISCFNSDATIALPPAPQVPLEQEAAVVPSSPSSSLDAEVKFIHEVNTESCTFEPLEGDEHQVVYERLEVQERKSNLPPQKFGEKT